MSPRSGPDSATPQRSGWRSGPGRRRSFPTAALLPLLLLVPGRAPRAQEPEQAHSHHTTALPFFAAHCVKCHGPDKAKGDITLHAFAGDPAAGAQPQTK